MAIESIHLDPDSSIPLSHQLKQQLTWLIASGALASGDRLPPVRELAKDLSINLHTVRQAYLKLEAEGLVETRLGAARTSRHWTRCACCGQPVASAATR